MTSDNTPDTDDTAVAAELAKPEDVSEYIAERQEQEAEDQPKDELTDTVQELSEKHGLEDKKNASRYERLKRARDSAQAENAELRRQLGERSDPNKEASPNFDRNTTDSGAHGGHRGYQYAGI